MVIKHGHNMGGRGSTYFELTGRSNQKRKTNSKSLRRIQTRSNSLSR